MITINSTSFGSIIINNKKYSQVLIIGEEIKERNAKKLNELFGTTHQIGDWEIEDLISNSPEIIIIGTGQRGVLKVSDEFKSKIKESGVELKTFITSVAIKEYNKFILQGKKVNALIHTTC